MIVSNSRRHPVYRATSTPLMTRQDQLDKDRRDVSLTLAPPCFVCGLYYHGGVIHEIEGRQIPLCFVCYGEDDLPNLFLIVIAFLREEP